MTFRILVVCSANSCRSPVIAVALHRSLLMAGLGGDVRVSSAGTNAVPGRAMCEEMLGRARAQGLPAVGLEQHRSVVLSDAALAQADLILAADRAVRSGVLRQSGGRARERTFTLREAAQLASETRDGTHSGTVAERLHLLPTVLHHTRGFTELPRTERVMVLSRPWRPLALHAHDVPDAHEEPAAPHRLLLRLITMNVEQLIVGLTVDARRWPS